MRMKAAFLLGGAVGYVLGTRAGRQQFEKIRTQAQRLWEDPRVQEGIADVEQRASDLVKEKGPEIKEKVTGAVRSANDAVRGGDSDDSEAAGGKPNGTTA
ncbi:YtxH domain-containing protein [Cellulomonas bogoriensis]|uniref:YtxH domain-containing protein n=1 Tax=Cellulomonas bogoriensis 69B4 = DSM 16987 TaxID=1386082 RepID=A0A0A0C2B8_9CELL|nr:YtxH domain-containing protein [Cellulomonas bogoriensis]KGM14321.1 hypothetical protein N869_15110 [Cellulomonas bogoriensis 69B4 = DSM 16987]